MHGKRHALIDISLPNIAYKGSEVEKDMIYRFIDFGSITPFN